jgi:hypothetical protein
MIFLTSTETERHCMAWEVEMVTYTHRRCVVVTVRDVGMEFCTEAYAALHVQRCVMSSFKFACVLHVLSFICYAGKIMSLVSQEQGETEIAHTIISLTHFDRFPTAWPPRPFLSVSIHEKKSAHIPQTRGEAHSMSRNG